ncbi:hypothetical protein FSARC_12722 [Fusarium sarcochroum]|uniref:Transcription factor domain-containing protein n=1 Tax=Fusarium sarcochroum TaxID=1208366 RepID=A0A8H4T665_9HYPO|nr:hypothetical protein FSARC_12722 [Fusarium sarcochroum]
MQSFQQTSPGSFYRPVKTFDAGFPIGTEKGLTFIDESLRSQDPGIISKCLVWLCLSFQQLPRDFEDTETGLPLCSQELITRYLVKVDTFYLASSKPVCSIDFVEALILQHELFTFMGRPSKAWKCIRAGIENAMLLGLHRPGRSALERGVWDALWIRDRQLSLFLGLPYAVPEHLTLKAAEDKYSSPEKEVFRKIATISGHIIDRDQSRQDAQYSTTSRIDKEMAELKAMMPDHWGTQSDFESAFSLAQVFVHTNVRLLYYTINQMLHLPYAQSATQNEKNERDRAIVLESAEGAIQAYQDMRALDVRPYGPPSCEFFDFLAFSAAAILAIDLASQETSRPAEEEQRLWNLITVSAYTMNKVGEVLDSTVGDQSAEVLENFQAACSGTFTGLEPYEAIIPYFGRIKISRFTEKKQYYTRQNQQSETEKNVVELESNVFSFRLPNEYVTERELAEDWGEGANVDLEYDWKRVYEFLASSH